MRAASLVGLSGLFVILWSSGWLASQLAMNDLSVMNLLTARYLIVLLGLLFIVTVAGQWRRIRLSDLLGQLCVGILSHGIYLITALGAFQQGVSAAVVTFVITLHPIATAMLSGSVNHEQFTARQWKGLFVGSLAVLVLISHSHGQGTSGLALTLPFMAVIALTLGTLLNRHLELENQSANTTPLPVFFTLLIQSAGALIFLLPIGAIQGSISMDFSSRQWVLLLWLALVASIGAYAVLQLLLRNMPSTQVACLTYLVPPVTTIQIYLVFGEQLDSIDLTGILLAAAGVIWVMTSPNENSSDSQYKLQPRAPGQRQPTLTSLNLRISTNSGQAVDIEL
ncbi:DMT family transporter [Granulosicoccus antarcticus]|uniref:EamA domain-containing protein n=1 Tax=Granulosicoccus antarcticus IMCC3135 TaxID=1192854 RepID=A0A2Z2P0C1_9GAMM|nr:DMT family transporter [Granulosicoccus antarcticus]ASJ75528.1 hypothetical protein IMCC3135_27370 [Granulosicoccus antarcticus IMCC3135]